MASLRSSSRIRPLKLSTNPCLAWVCPGRCSAIGRAARHTSRGSRSRSVRCPSPLGSNQWRTNGSITDNHSRLAAPFNQSGQFPCRPSAGNRRVRNRCKAFAGDIIDDIQDAEPPFTAKLIVDEPKVREAKSSDQRALARASIRIGARVPMALRLARRLRTVSPSSRYTR